LLHHLGDSYPWKQHNLPAKQSPTALIFNRRGSADNNHYQCYLLVEVVISLTIILYSAIKNMEGSMLKTRAKMPVASGVFSLYFISTVKMALLFRDCSADNNH